MKILRILALASSVVLANSAFAAPYSDMYVFGDSLFDTGNAVSGARATNLIVENGVVTSEFGPVSPDLVAAGLGLDRAAPSEEGGTNYAVGAHESSDTLESITADSTYDAPAGRFTSFFANLESGNDDFSSNALYVLDGGGNDIGNFKVISDADALVVATNMYAAAAALADRGAEYVVIANVPAFGFAPRGIAFKDFANGRAALINTEIANLVGDQNILIFDAYNTLAEIVADPEAFGIPLTADQISYSCFTSDAGGCDPVGANSANQDAKISGSDPDPYQFFFNDGLHPTTLGQEIFADYMLALLTAPGQVSLLPEIGVDDVKSVMRTAKNAMRDNRFGATEKAGTVKLWGGLSQDDKDYETSYGDAENETTRNTVGVSYQLSDSVYLGAMVSRGDNELEFSGSKSSYEMESLSFVAMAGYRKDRLFVEGAVSVSDLDYDDLERTFSLGPVLTRTEAADTEGDAKGITFNVGYSLIQGDNYQIGSILGYEYIDIEVDGYQEESGFSTALNVAGQDISSKVWSVGLMGDMTLSDTCKLYSEVVYENETEDDQNDTRIGLVTIEGNSAKLPGYQRDGDAWRWDLGINVQLTAAMDINVGAGVTKADDSDNLWYGAELGYRF